MSNEERIEEADKAAIFDWLENQTKGTTSVEQKEKKIGNYIKALNEMLDKLSKTKFKKPRKWRT